MGGRLSGPHYRNHDGNGVPRGPHNLGVPLIRPQTQPNPNDVIEFDGLKFPRPIFLQAIGLFEIAYRARRGDEAATATLTASGIWIKAVDGSVYWPLQAAAEQVTDPESGAQSPAPPSVPQ